MSNTGCKGVDVRQTGNELVFEFSLKDSSGVKVTTGTANLYLFEKQSDGTLKTYDWNDNTFKTGTCTTVSATMTHQTGNNTAYNTGIWTKALSTLTGFTVGAVYYAQVSHSSAAPAEQERMFQYGSAEGDLVVVSSGTGTAWLQSTLSAILGTGLTETVGGYLAAAFKKFLDVAAPVFTSASVNQTGDNYARIGAPAGASVSADIAAIKSDTGTTLTDVNTGAGAIYNRIGAPAGASIAADIAAVKTDTGNLVTRITSTLFSGITSLAQWLGMIAGKQTGNSTARTEIRATGAGSGTYDETTDSLEAIRDRGDASWTTETGTRCNFEAALTTSAGAALRVEAWLEDQNLSQIDQTTGATCTVTFRELGSHVDLLTLTPALDTTNHRFYIEQATPGFTGDRGYIVTVTIVDASSVTHGPTTYSNVVFG